MIEVLQSIVLCCSVFAMNIAAVLHYSKEYTSDTAEMPDQVSCVQGKRKPPTQSFRSRPIHIGAYLMSER